MKMRRLMAALLIAVLLAVMSACAPTDQNESVKTEGIAEEITLDSIAQLNSCSIDELITVFDEDGYLTFIGNRVADTKIADRDDAEQCLKDMGKLLGLDGINLMYYKTDTSPRTGTVYYTFNQVAKGEIAGVEDASVEFFSTTIKLAVDKDGYPCAVSSYLNHEIPPLSDKKMITAEDAVKTVEELIPGLHIYPEKTELTYWEDTTAAAVSLGSKIALSWLVYADDSKDLSEIADAISEQDADAELFVEEKNKKAEDEIDIPVEEACTEYYAFVVSAIDSGEGRGQLLCVLNAPSLDAYQEVRVNTTNAFFDDMEDVGEYTYTVDFKWMSDEDRDDSIKYVGADTMEVTVPVMKSKKDGLYYLGEKEHHLYMSNYTDMIISSGDTRQFNPYVTEDPTKLDAWHFKKDTFEATGQKYFDDPDYVIASFAEYRDTVMAFGNKFDLFNQYPTDSYLLATYATYVPGVYPDNLRGFQYNAANGGQISDWITFLTSPNLALCLDDSVMSHEFTHGVNMHFANAKYMNEQGAMMESYADIIGYYMAKQDSEDDDWYIGGTFGPKLRSIKNPCKSEAVSEQPRYKKGLNYLSPIDYELIYDTSYDYGGVHINSGAPNYLGYLMTQGTTNDDNEQQLTKEDVLYLWYETLFLGNYNTDFIDQGAYLRYASKAIGLSEEKDNFINRLMSQLGFIDGTVEGILLDSEDSSNIIIKIYYDSEDTESRYKLGTWLTSEDDGELQGYEILGGFAEGNEQVSKIENNEDYNVIRIDCHTADGEEYHGKMSRVPEDTSYEFKINHAEADADEGYVIDSESELMNIDMKDIFKVNTDNESGETKITAKEEGACMIITRKEGTPEGEYDLCMTIFTKPEIPEE